MLQHLGASVVGEARHLHLDLQHTCATNMVGPWCWKMLEDQLEVVRVEVLVFNCGHIYIYIYYPRDRTDRGECAL